MIAITGAAGFIGSNLAHRLSSQGESLLLVDHPVDRAVIKNWQGLPDYPFLGHRDFLDALHKGDARPAAIFHLGACSSTTETNWDYLQDNNVDYTRSLWQWCAASSVPFLYASSAATYGDGSRGFSDQTHPNELLPLNLYGKSKNDFDAWALAEQSAGRPMPPRWAGLKFFNVYGPYETHKGRMASVVYQTWKQVKATGKMLLFRSNDPAYADGGQVRDFVYVQDCIDHMIWHWKADSPCGIYNSGTGSPRTFQDLATAVFVALGLKPEIRFIDMPADLIGRYQNFTQADMRKLYATGYRQPATSLEEGVKETVCWLETLPD